MIPSLFSALLLGYQVEVISVCDKVQAFTRYWTHSTVVMVMVDNTTRKVVITQSGGCQSL